MAAAKRHKISGKDTEIRYVSPTGELADRQGVPIRNQNGKGLLRIRAQELLTAEDVQKALSGYIAGTLRLDKDRLDALKVMSEILGLRGPGRKPVKPDENDATPAAFSASAEHS